MGSPMSREEHSVVTPLRALLEVTRLVGSETDVEAVLEAVAATISDTLGFRTVAMNLYRPAWDDFQIAVVHGNEEARKLLLGHADPLERWAAILNDRFARRGAYWIPGEEAPEEDESPLAYTAPADEN